MADTRKHLIGRITRRIDHAPDLWTIRLLPEQAIRFEPGQYATLGVQNGDRPIERPYSIASSPVEPELEFFFELVPDGALTPHLYKLGVGSEVLVRPLCKGRFQLDRKSGRRKHFLVSTVTGVAPYVSMARTLVGQVSNLPGSTPDLELIILQVGSRSFELGYAKELEGLAQRHSWIKYIPAVSRHWEDANWKGERGRAEDLVRTYADKFELTPENSVAYLCGHPAMIENSDGILHRAGWPKEVVHKEVYWVP